MSERIEYLAIDHNALDYYEMFYIFTDPQKAIDKANAAGFYSEFGALSLDALKVGFKHESSSSQGHISIIAIAVNRVEEEVER